jgi:hypothetical protein
MVARFTSLLTRPILRSAFSGFVFAFLSLFLLEYGGGTWATLLFLAAAIFLYVRPSLNAVRFGASFVALAVLPFVLPSWPVDRIVIAAVLGAIFTALLGVKNLVFLRRREWYAFVHLSLVFLWGTALLSAGRSIPWGVGAFLLFFFLVREFYRTMSALEGNRLMLTAALGSLLAVELLGVLALLPIGFIASAAIFTLIVYVLSDTFLHHLNGRLSRRLVLWNATFLVLSSLLVMAASYWSLSG